MNKINIYARTDISSSGGSAGSCNSNGIDSNESLSELLYQKTDETIASAIAGLKTFLTPTENDWQIRADKQLTEWNNKINTWFENKAREEVLPPAINNTSSTTSVPCPHCCTTTIDERSTAQLKRVITTIGVVCLLLIATSVVLSLTIRMHPIFIITTVAPIPVLIISLLAVEGFASLRASFLDEHAPEKTQQSSFQKISETQAKIDTLGREIKKLFSPLAEFNNWLEMAGTPDEPWHMQLAIYLVKLPLRSIRNILQLLYNIIETILTTAVHPLNSTIDIAKMIVAMIHSLTQPETWTKIGVGVIGMHLGQILIFASPLSPIALGIGAAMMVAGLSMGPLRAAILAELDAKDAVQKAAKANLFQQVSELPECFLTSFFMGMIVGGVQKFMSPRFTTIEEARKFADKYVRKHRLPAYRDVRLHANGKVIIDWSHDAASVNWFRTHHPKLFRDQGYYSDRYHHHRFKIVFPNHGGGYAIAGASWDKPPTLFAKFKRILPRSWHCGSRNQFWWTKHFRAAFTPLSKVNGL